MCVTSTLMMSPSFSSRRDRDNDLVDQVHTLFETEIVERRARAEPPSLVDGALISSVGAGRMRSATRGVSGRQTARLT
jgi:hypothetical protein